MTTSQTVTPKDTPQGTRQDQHQVNQRMHLEGVRRYRKKRERALQSGRESQHGATQHLLSSALPLIEEKIETFVKEAMGGSPHRRAAAAVVLQEIDAATAAYITLRTVLDKLSRSRKLTALAITVGSRIEDELRARALKKVNPALHGRLVRKLKKSADYRYKHKVFVHLSNIDAGGDGWEGWTVSKRLLVGTRLLDMLTEVGLFQIESVRHGRRTYYVFKATPETLRMIAERDSRCESMSPWFMPMVERPKEWTTPYDGGYHHISSTLVKTRSRDWLEQMQWVDMPAVYASVNALQNTAWRVNEDVLVVAEELRAGGGGIAGLPPAELTPLPVMDFDPTTEPRKLKAWKRAASVVHSDNATRSGHIIETAQVLWLADLFRSEPSIYFPHQLDWRGRVYTIPSYLTPQGSDLARGLLSFGAAKPIGVDGGRWLAIHLANTFGVDKVSLEDRVSWTIEHSDRIVQCAEDPLTHLWWAEADKPWQALAACLEWAGYVTDGAKHMTRLPIQMDGSCNGLQHLSAMAGDKRAAAAVNMLPSDKPADLYQQVADVVEGLVRMDATAIRPGGNEQRLAQAWLNSGLLDRKCVKRQCMTRAYSATLTGHKQQLLTHLRQVRAAKGEDAVPFADTFEAVSYLSNHIWSAIDEVVEAAKVVMAFLKACSSVASKEELPIYWTAPSGFPVMQHYQQTKSRVVETMLLGKGVKRRRVQLRVMEAFDKLDKRKQAAGVSPNFVHSLDAAHLMLTIQECMTGGTQPWSFSMVHDSYGTHAPDCETLARVLRETFVEIYREDVLERFRDDIAAGLSEGKRALLPEVPARGGLDIEQVKGAEFFFA